MYAPTLPQKGTDLERGYGDVPWRPPFHTSFVVRKGPISSKRVSSQDPLLRKFWNLTLYTASIFAQTLALKPPNLEIFSSQAHKFGNFQFTSPLFQSQISVRKPHTSEIRAAPAHTLPEKSWVPPGTLPGSENNIIMWFIFTRMISNFKYNCPPAGVAFHRSSKLNMAMKTIAAIKLIHLIELVLWENRVPFFFYLMGKCETNMKHISCLIHFIIELIFHFNNG